MKQPLTKQARHPTVAKAWEVQAVDLHEDDLRQAVESVLPVVSDGSESIQCLTRRPCEFATLFPIDVVEISFASGRKLGLLLKHFGDEDSSHPDKCDCPQRELFIYRQLLRDPGLPVPKYYGDRFNEGTQRHELFLEYVDDWSLKYHELRHWETAVRRLAQLHANFAMRADHLSAYDFLSQFDSRYLETWAQRAISAVCELSSTLAIRLERLVSNYGAVVNLIASQPKTLVHNDLSPKNVIAKRSEEGAAQICIIDWEMAGVGCGVLDLAHLKYGLDAGDDRALVEAYCEEIRSHHLLPKKSENLERLVTACDLHKTVYRLAHCVSWQLPCETVARWVTECEEMYSRVSFSSLT